jgi:hypothetical protein
MKTEIKKSCDGPSCEAVQVVGSETSLPPTWLVFEPVTIPEWGPRTVEGLKGFCSKHCLLNWVLLAPRADGRLPVYEPGRNDGVPLVVAS